MLELWTQTFAFSRSYPEQLDAGRRSRNKRLSSGV